MKTIYLLIDAIGITAKRQGWKRTERLYQAILFWKARRLLRLIAKDKG